MAFDISAEVAELRQRVAAFVREVAIPAERCDKSEHGLDDGLRTELQAAATGAGLFCTAD